MSEQKEPAVVPLVDAGVPADQGLASLGMLMELAGSVFAAAAGIFVLASVFDNHGAQREVFWTMFLLAISVARSLFHRSAGTLLLYGVPGSPEGQKHRMRGVRRYVIAALVHTAIVGVVLLLRMHAPLRTVLAVSAGLAVWPVCLMTILALPRFRRFHDDLPLTEDKGFEGAAILMTVLGLCGVVATATVLVALVDESATMTRGPGVLIALALVMLVIRSVLHVQAGISGLRETSLDRSVELVNRYANFGVISSFCGGGALLLFFVTRSADVFGLAVICALCWMLMAWPLTVRHFFADRQFADLMAGDQAPVHRRAPDAGLTSLGWLLIAHAMFEATIILPQLLGGGWSTAALLTGMGIRSVWFSVGVTVLQTWAGYELVRMSPQSRGIATLFGIVGTAITLYVNWPALKMLQHASGIVSKTDAAMVGPIVFALILPIATIALVNRAIAPTARARFRAKPGA